MIAGGSGALPRRGGADAGFSLLEALVAALILAILATSMATVLTSEMRTSKDDRQRVAASTLAAREQAIVRNTFATSDADALAVASQGVAVDADPIGAAAGSPTVLNGVPYTVKRTVAWLPVGNGQSACDGGSIVTYPSLRVHVEVTWPDMGTTVPVTSDTLLTPGKNVVNGTSAGYLAVRVTDHTGQPSVGRVVTATGPAGASSAGTDTSGCAVFRLSAAGDYTVSLSEPGYVDYYGNPTPTKVQNVPLGTLQRISMTYDRAAQLAVTLDAPPGYQLPANLPAVTVANSGLQTNQSHSESFASAGVDTTIANLWPFADGYSVWSGGCADADPAGAPTLGSRAAPVLLTPGAAQSTTAALVALDVYVQHSDGSAVRDATVVATDSAGGCVGGEGTLTLGTTDGNGHLPASVPYGSWVLSAGGAESDAVVPTQSGPASVYVVVP